MRKLYLWLCCALMAGISISALAEEMQPIGPVEPFGPEISGKREPMPSLMFSQTDIRNLIKVLRARHFMSGEGELQDGIDDYDESEDAILEEIRRRALQEEQERQAETTLPDFYIASIMYRSENDWTVWLRKFLFTPIVAQTKSDKDEVLASMDDKPVAMKTTQDFIALTARQPVGDYDRIKVLSVTPDKVVLEYRPDAAIAAANRYRKKEEPTDRLTSFNNRVVSQPIAYDFERNFFTVTLKTNQTFSINMMRVIEGKTVMKAATIAGATPDIATAGAERQAEAGNNEEEQPFVNGDSPEAQAANKLIGDILKVQEFLPINQMK